MKSLFCLLIITINAFFSHVQESKHCEFFLSLDFKGKIPIYSTTDKKQIVTRIGHDFKNEDMLSFDIFGYNDSMYYVKAVQEISGKSVKGWISKKNNYGIFSRAYNKNLLVYNSPDKKTTFIKVQYIADELKVIDCFNTWLKVKFKVHKKSIVGWIPSESQCSNPYSTCN